MRLLIAYGSLGKLFHLNAFSDALKNQNIAKNVNFFDQDNFKIINNHKSARTCSNLNDYYNKVEMIILEILYMNPNGLKSEVLYDFLNARLQSEMHPWMFSADNFQDFLAIFLIHYIVNVIIFL